MQISQYPKMKWFHTHPYGQEFRKKVGA
ncbi:hypothetical protein ACJIZ3_015991 [Penstemon smallii]|uniref:Uncharacterized protein n=1 Tax=Penstemon smallii TaxID=265156 RepID=A0ABD3RPC2_9LAMI